MATIMNILLIDDDDVDRMAVRRSLARAEGMTVHLDEAVNLAEGLEAFKTGSYDCALLDLNLPDGTAFDMLSRVCPDGRSAIPIVILSGEHDGEHSLQLLTAGAQDYLVKARISTETLLHAIRYAMARHQRMALPAAGPVSPPQAGKESTVEIKPEPIPHRLLVADADPARQAEVAHWLVVDGFEVDAVSDQAGLQAQLATDPPELLVCELESENSPLVRLLAGARPPAMPILFTTSIDWDVAQRCLGLFDRVRVLVRPFTPRQLVEMVHSLLNSEAARPSHHLSPGSQLRGYEMGNVLGVGGMGTVYAARQIELDRKVALKVLPAELTNDFECIERFKREARVLASLDHPNIIPIYDMFEVQGRFHIVMGFAGGGSTGDLIEERGALNEALAARLISEAARGLHAAECKGIVHRDVKPDNLLLNDEGTVRVADFGLAKMDDRQAQVTQTGFVLGTPAYMAPEQWDDQRVPDGRTDLYALGCTLFYFLTARLPFPGNTPASIMRQHILSAPPRLAAYRPDVSAEICAVVQTLLHKDPEQRFQNGTALAEALSGSGS